VQELLERTDHGIERIAAECGLTPLILRRHFTRRLGASPQSYRRRFSQTLELSEAACGYSGSALPP
jgi:transcriptional regulator GlxA family with amidase domain